MKTRTSTQSLVLGLLAAFALVAACVSVAAPHVQGGDSAFAWSFGRDDFVNYDIEVVRREDSKHEDTARHGQVEDVAGFHGYEPRDGKTVSREIAYETLLHVPFVFRLPPRLAKGSRATIDEMERSISDAGFVPKRRRQDYSVIEAEAVCA